MDKNVNIKLNFVHNFLKNNLKNNFFFETGCHSMALADMNLTVWTSLSGFEQRCACLCLCL